MDGDSINILFLAAGRRVSLLRSFQAELKNLNINGKIIAADSGKTAPSSYVADKHIQVPRVDHPEYINTLLKICQQEKISLVTSLIDTDLLLLSQNQEKFEKLGAKLLVSSPEANHICFDKRLTYSFFKKNNIPTIKVFSNEEIKNLSDEDFPVILKPFNGSSGVGVTKINNQKELNFFLDYIPNAMVQELAEGTEFTIDVYIDFNSKVRCLVPRQRLEIRAGEISKGITRKDKDIISATKNLIEKLPPCIGCITVQCFKDEKGNITFIEINPRFGGGYPLSYHAKANFPRWILEELSGKESSASEADWIDNLVMLRYDDEIILNENDLK